MRTTQGNTLQSLRAVKAFLVAYAARLGDILESGKAKELDQAISEIEAHHATQVGSQTAYESNLQHQRKLRAALVSGHMRPIARLAKSDLPNTPEVRPLRMPRGAPSIERLTGMARGMGEVATGFSDTFVAGGLPTDFVSRLNVAAAALQSAVDAGTQLRRKRVGATKGLETKLARSRTVVGVIDALVRNALAGDQVALAEWAMVKRVRVVGIQASPDGNAGADAAPKSLPTTATETTSPAGGPNA